MAVSTKTKWSQLKVGLMALAAMAILAFLIFLMSGVRGFFQPKSTVYTYLSDSAAIAEGADVRLNGILIGKVSKVELSGMADPNRVVRVTMQIDDRFMNAIPVDSQAGLSAANLLGVKFINIKRGRGAQTIMPGSEIPSQESAALEDLFQQGSTTLAAAESILKRLDAIVSEIELGKGNIGKFLVDETLYKNFVAITEQFQKLMADITDTINSNDNSVGKLLNDNGALYDDVRGSVARINTLVDDIDHGQGTIAKMIQDPALFDQVRELLADTRKILTGIENGEGTLGKLVKSDELHEQIRGTIGRVDTLLDKMNNGQGTIAQLLNNPQLYESIDGTTREMQGLLKDFRANPKKFLRIKLGLF